MKILARFGAFAAFALSANALAALDYGTPNCTPDKCAPQITVSGAGCGGGITVSPDPLLVKAGKSVDIQWTVATPGWSFAEPGIRINLPMDEFDSQTGKLSADKKQAKVRNKASKQGTYKYDIVLVDAKKNYCTLDPTILNY